MIYPDRYTKSRLDIEVYGMHEDGKALSEIAREKGMEPEMVRGIVTRIWKLDEAAFRDRDR